MKNKEFDCVEMQDRAALRIHETLKGMTREEELAYWRERSEEAQKKYPRMETADVPFARTR
jgi:hypothetical protein